MAQKRKAEEVSSGNWGRPADASDTALAAAKEEAVTSCSDSGESRQAEQGSATLSLKEQLRKLEVKFIVKENHLQPIVQVCFNRLQAENRNLLATVGGNQVTVLLSAVPLTVTPYEA